VGVQFGGGYNDSRGSWQYGYARGRDEGYKEGERDARPSRALLVLRREELPRLATAASRAGWARAASTRAATAGATRKPTTQAFRRFAGYDRLRSQLRRSLRDPRYDRLRPYDRYDR
jgi:hypothetical protein